jgi:hypothetical protein
VSETQVAALEQLLDRVRARASLPGTRLVLRGAHGDAASEAETGLDQTGLDQTGLDQTGLDQTGLDQTGLDQTGLAESGVTGIAEATPELPDIAVPALDEPTTETALVADEPTAEMLDQAPAVAAGAEDIDVELDFDADEIEVTSDELDSGVDVAPTTEVSAADIRPAPVPEARPELPPAEAEALPEPPTPVAAPAPAEAVATTEHGEPAFEPEGLGAEAIEVTVDEVELSAASEAPPAASVGEALAEPAPAEEAPAEETPPEEAALEVAPAEVGPAEEAALEVAPPEAPAMATMAPVIDVPVPTELGREESAIGSSSEVATLRRATGEPQPSVKTTTPGMPAPVLTSGSETVTAKGAQPAGPPPLPSASPERQPTAVEDRDTVTVGAPPPLPPEARASGLSPRAVVPERPTSARVGDFIGELEPMTAPSFGDALDASLALSF